MPPRKIVGLGGSLRADSRSRAALQTAMEISRELGAEVELLDLRDLALPLFVPDQPIEAYPAASRGAIEAMVASFRSADAMLWVTPTYHGSMTGAMKNAIDYAEFLADDPAPYLQGRAVGLVSVNDSSPLAAMAACVHELRAWLAPTRVALSSKEFTEARALASESGERRLRRVVSELVAFR